MGKQINFYMTHKDMNAFLKGIRQIRPFRMLRNAYKNEKARWVKEVPQLGISSYLFLCQTNPEPRIIADYVLEQHLYIVDFFESEVVEFSPSQQKIKQLFPGRLWFEPKRRRGKKPATFICWADGLLGWIRKNYRRDGFYYIGPDADEKAKKGKVMIC